MSTPLFSENWKDSPTRARAETIVRNIQDRICAGVLALEGAGSKFHEDVWHREDRSEGGGITRVLQVRVALPSSAGMVDKLAGRKSV